jgi:hypothetical protein
LDTRVFNLWILCG